uniref:Uncharacterized protein n=1 Tax=Populus trichocarpa TaxID=3694 RepID=B9GU44_POPTR
MAETNKHLKGVFLVAQPQFFLYWFASEILRKHYKIFATSWRENAHVHLVTLMPQLDCCGLPSMDVGGRSLLVADIISDAVSRDLSFLRAPLPVDVGDSLLAIPLAKVFSTEDTLAWEHWMLYN